MRKILENKSLIYLFSSILISYLFLFDTTRDWDHFISALHVDSIGFLENFSPIKWSYLLCGGVTRIGDPQSFSYSPLLFIPILFGGFWGSKILVVFSFFIGALILDQFFSLLKKQEVISPLAKYTVVLGTVFSNYFLAHITEGHLTFVLMFYSFGIVLIIFRIFLNNTINLKEFLLGSFLTYLTFSSGFYAVAIYFAIPCLISFLIVLPYNYKSFREIIKPLTLSLIPVVFGLLLSIPKLYGVLEYQLLYPRALPVQIETNSLEVILYYLAPIYKSLYLGFVKSTTLWGSWEKTAFTPLLFILIFTTFKRFKSKSVDPQSHQQKILIQFSKVLFCIGLLLSMGDFIPQIAPYTHLKSLFNNSIRVPFRFSIATVFSMFILLISHPNLKNLKNKTWGVILSIIFLNTITFRKDNSAYRLDSYSSHGVLFLGEYSNLTFVPRRNHNDSSMYPALNNGFGVYNCYMPLQRDTYVSNEFSFDDKNILKSFSFIHTKVHKACLKESYFSQEHIVFSPKCPKRLCLNLNGLNLYDKNAFLKTWKDVQSKRICVETN